MYLTKQRCLCQSLIELHRFKILWTANIVNRAKLINREDLWAINKTPGNLFMSEAECSCTATSVSFVRTKVRRKCRSVEENIAELRKFIVICEFKCDCRCSVAEIFLQAQFIWGLRDATIREKLLQITELTFKKAIDTALTLKASKLDNFEISSTSKKSIKNVNCIFKSKLKANKHSSRPENRKDSQKNCSNRQTRVRSKIDYCALGLENVCTYCGQNSHKV